MFNQNSLFSAMYMLLFQISGAMGTDSSVVLELENSISAGPATLNRVKCIKAGNMAWESLLTSKIIAAAGNKLVLHSWPNGFIYGLPVFHYNSKKSIKDEMHKLIIIMHGKGT